MRVFAIHSVAFFNESFGEIGIAKPNIPKGVGIIMRWVSLGFDDFRFLCPLENAMVCAIF